MESVRQLLADLGLDADVWGVPLWRWVLGAAAVFAIFSALMFVRRLARGISDKDDDIRRIVWRTLRRTSILPSLAIALYFGALIVPHPKFLDRGLNIALVLGVALQIGLYLTGAFITLMEAEARRRSMESPEDMSSLGILRFLGQLVIWTVVLLVTLANLDVNITGLVASLGVGGIAVALAAQNILGDLFASLSIVLDKPFQVGDFVVVDAFAGTVKSIGLKTTRMQALSGEEVVFSNAGLLNSRIQNFKKMEERRVLFRFGVTYDTPEEDLRRLPDLVKSVVEPLEGTRFDRAHFQGFGPSSLDYEVVYYVMGRDYGVYMDRQQSINFELVKAFRASGISFAFPTQTLHVASLPRPEADVEVGGDQSALSSAS